MYAILTQATLYAADSIPVGESGAGHGGDAPVQEYVLCKEKLAILTAQPALTPAHLAVKSTGKLKELASEVRMQRQAMADFEGFVSWMNTNLSGYAKYIDAGSLLAGFAKVLPIPYAGQASVFTKFVSQGVLSLNAASVSINRYLATSQQFLAKVDAVGEGEKKTVEVAEIVKFADGPLLKDMTDVQNRLVKTSEISSSTLAFLEALNHYVKNTDEYWNKTKSLFSKDAEKKEKGFLTENIAALKNRASSFDVRLKGFDENTRRSGPAIKALVVYGDLLQELEKGALVSVR
jgi:hypothetical protein